MTTYPLSEPATIYAAEGNDLVGQGSLADCAEIIEALPSQQQASVRIEMDDLELRFGPQEVGDLLRFLRDESAGLSNQEIAAITDRQDT